MDARLEARRSNSEPKCANCGWWQGGSEASSGRCDRHVRPTLDLMVCSEWRDADVVQDVMPPEEPLPDDVPRWTTEE